MKKRKLSALLLSGVLSLSLLAGCSSSEETEEILTGTYYGQVTAVDAEAGTITIDVGSIDESGDAAAADASSMISLTGESQTVTVTDDTTLTSQVMSMGGMQAGDAAGGTGAGGMGDASGDLTMPDGGTGDGTDAGAGDGSGEIPDDSAGAEGEAPSDADAGTADGSVPDEIPSDAAAGGEDFDADGEEAGGEAPSGDMASDDSMPDGGAASGDMAGGFGGDLTDGQPSDASGDAGDSGTSTEITFDDIAEGDIISVTYDDAGAVSEIVLLYDSDAAQAAEETESVSDGDQGGMTADMAGVTTATDIEYTALVELGENTTLEGETYDSTGTDEETVWVNSGAVVTLSDMTLTRTSSDSTGGDDSSFYGVGASLLTTVGTTYLTGSTITTDAAGGAGIFSYGDGITYVSDTTITTQQDTSGGIHVAGGGTLYAWDLTVETNGESSAAIRSDRGSGTMVVDGGAYTSNGTGSPAVYSTAEIAVNEATLTATGSEAVCIEGLNSVYLFDSDLTGNMADDDQNDTTWTVTLYQSQSGDSEEGNSTFQMIGGTLTSGNGGLFYTTNTESTFLLSGVDITSSDDSEFFLMCTGNANERGWGTTGSNGADCSFTAIDQEMEGDVIWDSISELDFYITEGSTLTGAVVDDESYAGDGGSGYCSIYIDDESTWVVTGDSTVTNLYNAGTITDASGKTVSIVGTDGTTYVSGSGSYTITVENYSTSADLSDASSAASRSDFEVEKPDALN